MARIKMDELRNLTRDELSQKLQGFKTELFNLQYQATIGTLEKPHRISLIKRDISRILTILKEMESKDAKKS